MPITTPTGGKAANKPVRRPCKKRDSKLVPHTERAVDAKTLYVMEAALGRFPSMTPSAAATPNLSQWPVTALVTTPVAFMVQALIIPKQKAQLKANAWIGNCSVCDKISETENIGKRISDRVEEVEAGGPSFWRRRFVLRMSTIRKPADPAV